MTQPAEYLLCSTIVSFGFAIFGPKRSREDFFKFAVFSAVNFLVVLAMSAVRLAMGI